MELGHGQQLLFYSYQQKDVENQSGFFSVLIFPNHFITTEQVHKRSTTIAILLLPN